VAPELVTFKAEVAEVVPPPFISSFDAGVAVPTPTF
jgi:hypothetical protein